MIRRVVTQTLFAHTTVADVESVVSEIDSVGEDRAISEMLSKSGVPFFFTRMMLFPEEYRNLQRLGHCAKNEFLALHCHKDKNSMAHLIDRLRIPLMKTSDGQNNEGY